MTDKAGQSPTQEAKFVMDTIGPRWTAVGLGIGNRRLLEEWVADIQGSGGSDLDRRLHWLFATVKVLAEVEPPHQVVAYLTTPNRDLDERIPLLAIAEATQDIEAREVMNAAQTHVRSRTEG